MDPKNDWEHQLDLIESEAKDFYELVKSDNYNAVNPGDVDRHIEKLQKLARDFRAAMAHS